MALTCSECHFYSTFFGWIKLFSTLMTYKDYVLTCRNKKTAGIQDNFSILDICCFLQ